MTVTAAQARTRLAESLEASGVLRTPGWQSAFTNVPREVFASSFSVRAPGGLHAYSADHPDFWSKVYSDESLITLRDAAGTAISSSSQPSLMARMLEAFDVTEGVKVLEIGTGTGYNTALLCHRLGDENVVSVDIDPRLTAPARERLSSIGYQPVIITGDGTADHTEHGPYDGILATCGVNRIPAAWLRQLKPGGVIVTNIGTGIVRLTRQSDGSAQGRYLPEEAGFMLARPSADHVGETAKRYTGLIANATGRRTHTGLPVASWAEAEDFFRALVHPRALEVVLSHHDVLSMTLRDSQRTMHGLVHPATESWARIVPDVSGMAVDVDHGGERDLWTERLSLLLPWLTAGRPNPGSYGLTVNPDGHHTLWRETPAHCCWVLPPVTGSPAANGT